MRDAYKQEGSLKLLKWNTVLDLSLQKNQNDFSSEIRNLSNLLFSEARKIRYLPTILH